MATLVDIDRIKRIWVGMRKRCERPKDKDYCRYGARGVEVCSEWQSFESFAGWAITHGYRDDLTIDRIEPSAGYRPSNCRWLTRSMNSSRQAVRNASSEVGKLSVDAIESALKRRKRARLHDGKCLYLQVSSTGYAAWRWKYRIEGKEQILTIGAYPKISPAEAREQRSIAAKHHSSGKKPVPPVR